MALKTKPLTARQLQAKKTRSRLIKIGSELVAEHGFDAVTVDDITEACGVSKGTFYHYFESKSGLIRDIASQYEDGIQEAVCKSKGLPVSDRLELFAGLWLESMNDLSLALARQLLANTVLSGDGSMSFLRSALTEILEDAVENGELDNREDLNKYVNLYAQLLYGTAVCWCIEGGGFDPAERASEFPGLL